ncbi:MAG: hypothetical protein DWQ31_16985 [Planctomycetota bacterium]|nr:MAG: hypothetical protein DWQ31_16985 [Planctomycetota bacterium]REJ92050.1 MAG: hypothetical protein DWQ35_12935 [Planctomycetota bacterium]REK28586.1 MAG: hypothetical protein DWQ42_04525 [Planctomycetota bacterium]REK39201.1 MAG: hypothetical protein DWQ46_18110 [Planctomycetota bacterium]
MGDFEDLMWLCRHFGPLLIAVIFFIWRDWRREDRMSQRIDALEDEQRQIILPMVEKCTKVITENTAVMTRLEKKLDL